MERNLGSAGTNDPGEMNGLRKSAALRTFLIAGGLAGKNRVRLWRFGGD